MPDLTIPLIGGLTTRGQQASTALTAAKDQRFTNCTFDKTTNNITNQTIAYILKRNGFLTSTTVASSYYLLGAYWPYSLTGGPIVSGSTSAGATGNNTIFYFVSSSYVNCGTTGGQVVEFTEAIFNGITYLLFTDSAGGGWFLANDAAEDATPTFTGDTHTNTTIDNTSSLTNVYVGMLLSGTGIQAGTRVASIVSASSITTTLATTASNAGITITFERIAKIISANFPSVAQGRFVEMDGYLFVIGGVNQIYQSNLNSVTTWNASDFLTANVYPDGKNQLFKIGSTIYAQGPQSLEPYVNTGNAYGSVLSRVTGSAKKIGKKANFTNSLQRVSTYLEDDYFWIAISGGALSVMAILGGELQQISDDTTDMIINSVSVSLPCFYLDAFRYAGTRLLKISIITGSNPSSVLHTLMYDIDEKIWFEWPQNVATTITPKLSTLNTGAVVAFSAVLSNGLSYAIDSNPSSATYQDAGSSFTMTIQTQPYYLNNGLPFTIDNISLIADTQSSGSSTLSSTADDYATFQTIGSFDLTQQQKNLAGGGYYDASVAFKLIDSGNNAWRGQALKITWRPFQ